MESVRIAIIGGSGLYNMPDFTDVTEHFVDTPFGRPSDNILVGTLHGQRVAFLPRHGRGHIYTPSEVPYRANIYALKSIGVTHIIAVTACGSLKEELAPGHVVIPDQLYDFTKAERGRSFFGHGLVAHVGVAHPFCYPLATQLGEAASEAGSTVHYGGTSVTIEGPRFSTKGESAVWRKLDFSIIGMTTCPEAFLAREAEIHYAVMAHVTDYDVWHDEHVTAEMVLNRIRDNIKHAQQAIVNAVRKVAATMDNPANCGCDSVLKTAFSTAREKIPADTLKRLDAIIGKYF